MASDGVLDNLWIDDMSQIVYAVFKVLGITSNLPSFAHPTEKNYMTSTCRTLQAHVSSADEICRHVVGQYQQAKSLLVSIHEPHWVYEKKQTIPHIMAVMVMSRCCTRVALFQNSLNRRKGCACCSRVLPLSAWDINCTCRSPCPATLKWDSCVLAARAWLLSCRSSATHSSAAQC